MTDGNSEQAPPRRLLARASIHLPGVSLGARVWVDPDSPYIAGCLKRGYLVAVEQLTPEADPEAEVPVGDTEAEAASGAEDDPEPDAVEPIQLDVEAATDDRE